jgi:hypothetical protein
MTQTHTPTRTPKTRRNPAQTLDALLTRIAQEHLFIDTLETRNSDSMDFHDVSAWGVKEALLAAYQAGLAASQKAVQKAA